MLKSNGPEKEKVADGSYLHFIEKAQQNPSMHTQPVTKHVGRLSTDLSQSSIDHTQKLKEFRYIN